MAPKAPQPPEDQESPYLPAGLIPQAMEQFGGINTSRLRVGVPDEQCFWIDGYIPLDARNLRTLYSNGAALYTPSGKTIVCFYFANLGAVPIAVVFLSDGSVVQINLNTNAATTILPAATIFAPTITSVGVTQWGQQYVIIVANQDSGYWLWDGTLLFDAGTLSPTITINDPGNSYQTVPSVVISGGTGSGAAAVASIGGGFVTNVSITNPGSGYSVGDVVTANFVGGTAGGTGATLVAVLTHNAGGSGATIVPTLTLNPDTKVYVVTSASISSGGSGYSQYVTATVNGGSVYLGNNAAVSINLTGGVATSVVVNAGGGYSSGTPLPTITISDPGNYEVTSASITAGGAGYSPSTQISVSGGGSPQAQATLKPVLAAGVITSVVVLQGGNYGSNTPPTLAVIDSPAAATATVELMPFGIQGTAVETYSQRVWVINGPHLYFTAPGSFTDFSTSSGGGNQTSGDSFLRVGYTRLLNTNGFLFLISDSAVSYISGVQTVGDPPTTTFTYQNADPQVGSPYPCSVQAFGRSVMLANAVGIYEGSGGAFTKISDELDGVYNTVAGFGSVQISAAQAIIFNRKIFMELVRIVDPVSASTVNKLMMWNGKKWFASQQAATLTFINSNEINSILTAYGTDGTSLYALFQTPSVSLLKTVQSKYWDNPGYLAVKATGRFFAVAKYYDVTSPNVVLTIDAIAINAAGATVENTQPYTIAGPAGVGYFVTPPEAVGQQGVFTGMTIKTNCKDMALVSAAIINVDGGYRG